MKNQSKTKQALIQELASLRKRIAVLEQSESDRKKTEEALQESETRYRNLLEVAPVGIAVHSEGIIVFTNPAGARLLGGVSEEQIVGRSIFQIIHPDGLNQAQVRIQRMLAGEKNLYPTEDVYLKLDGTPVNVEVMATALSYQGKPAVQVIVTDVTERKKTEEALQESEDMYHSLFDNSIDAVLLTAPDGRILAANPEACRIFGHTEEEICRIGRAGLMVLTDPRLAAAIEERTRTGQFKGELTFVRKNGTLFPGEISSAIFRDRDGNLKTSMIIRDITDRKRVDEVLAKSEEKFRKAFYTSPDSVNINRLEDGMYISINPGFTRIMGYTEEDIIGKTSIEYNIWDNIEDRQRLVVGLKKDGEIVNLEAAFRTKGGDIRYGLMSASVIDLSGVSCILSITRDITERKRAEEDLKESENKYRLLADNVNDVIFVLDMNLNYTYVSPSVKILRGYEPEEVLKQPSIETLTPSSRDLAMRTISEVMELEKSEHGEIIISRTLQLEMRRKDGTNVWTEVTLSFIRDKDQRPVAILGVTRDITDRKRAEDELHRTLESLRKAFGATIQVMVSAVEARDPYTSGHQIRSADLARAIATEMGLPQEKIDGIRMAGSIHDIGKLSIPAEILSKPTKLTNIEFSLIKEHSQKGYEMLKDVESPWPLAQILYQHHERMDGSGYPRNLKGDDILLEARIMAVADVVEAMASHRPYRPGLGIDAALNEIEKNRGTFYDNAVADACLRLFREKGYQLEGT